MTEEQIRQVASEFARYESIVQFQEGIRSLALSLQSREPGSEPREPSGTDLELEELAREYWKQRPRQNFEQGKTTPYIELMADFGRFVLANFTPPKPLACGGVEAPQVEFSDKRCSRCGALRLTSGACSLIQVADGKGGCPDPTYDYYAERATVPAPGPHTEGMAERIAEAVRSLIVDYQTGASMFPDEIALTELIARVLRGESAK